MILLIILLLLSTILLLLIINFFSINLNNLVGFNIRINKIAILLKF